MAEEQITGAVPTPPVGTEQNAGQVTQPIETAEVKQVPLAALEEERGKRQSIEREADVLRRRTEFLEQSAAQQQATKYDPEDIPSFKDVVNLLDEREGRLRADSQQVKIEMQVNQARQKFSDWDEVYALGVKLAEANPGMADVIMKSVNPAMTAYDYGRLHPTYAEKTKQKVTQELAEKINGNLNGQKTLSDAGGGGNPSIEIDWRNKVGTKELHDKIHQVKFGRR